MQKKTAEYVQCGIKLGWLIIKDDSRIFDSRIAVGNRPDGKLVEIYQQGKDQEVLDSPQSLSRGDLMPSLTVELNEIF